MSWGLVRLPDQLALVFTYVDPSAGPSAKGSLLRGDAPSLDDARAAVARPNVTVRLAEGHAPRRLTAEELARLGLPEAPPWLAWVRPRTAGPWTRDPLLAGHFHPQAPDEVQAQVLGAGAEPVWVRLDARRPELEAWEGTRPEGTRVTVRGTLGAGPVVLSPVAEENLRRWDARCTVCGFDLVLEPLPVEPVAPFTRPCAKCRQSQRVVWRAQPRVAPAPPAPPEPATPPAPAGSSRAPVVLLFVLAVAALAALAVAFFALSS